MSHLPILEISDATCLRILREAELVAARANAIFNQLYVVNVNASQPAALGR